LPGSSVAYYYATNIFAKPKSSSKNSKNLLKNSIKMNKVTVSVFFISFAATSILYAQSAIVAAGGNASGSGGSVSYSVGQTSYTTISGTNGTVAQGVQQPFEISVVTATKEGEKITLECLVYPNPTQGHLKLIIVADVIDNLRFKLYNSNGVLLQNEKIESEETEILLENYSSSIYFLKVMNGNREIKTFKIVKN
jgi:hypothetical protein